MQTLYTAGAREYIHKKAEKILLPLTVVFSSFLMCNCTFLQGFSPLGVAFLAAFDENLFMYSVLGGVAGYFFFLIGRNSLRYLAALLLFMGLRLFLKFASGKNNAQISAVFCGISLLVTGIITVISHGGISDFAFIFTEAVLGGAAAFIFSGGTRAILNKSGLHGAEGLCIGVILAALYMSSVGFSIFGIKLARIVAVAGIFYSALYMGTTPSLITALSAGIVGSLAGESGALLYFSSAALAACAFLPAGKLFCGFGFLGAALIGGFLGGETDRFVFLLIETVAGISIGFLLSPKLARAAGVLKTNEKESGELFKRAAVQRIAGTAEALFEISDITSAVSREMEKVYGEPMEKYINNAINSCCKSCKSSPLCWQRNYSRTKEAVSVLFNEAKVGSDVSKEYMAKEIACEKSESMANFIEREAKKYNEFKSARGKAYNLRNVACDQFDGMAQLLNTVSKDSLRLQSFSERENHDIHEILLREGGNQESLLAVLDGENITISAEFESFKTKRMNYAAITDTLSEASKRSLSHPFETKIGDSRIRLCWHAYPNFKADWDFLQRSANNGRLCGDSVATSLTPDGNPIFLIADGMGAGGAAAVDSTMATALLSRLLSAGSSFEGALKIVNASLISSGDERLCTVDGAILNLITGEVNIYKAGAAPSFIIRGGRLCQIEKSALPAGILGGAQAAKSTFFLKEGDILLMVSDGITESGVKWIPSELQSLGEQPPAKICSSLIDTALIRNLTDRNDDMTVLAVKILKAY